MPPSNAVYQEKFDETVEYLKNKKRVLFITTSNRWDWDDELPKSTQLAYELQDAIGKEIVEVIDVTKLKIYPCEGNVSVSGGNNCGEKWAKIKDSEKNPNGELRCWASMNHEDDELWKISKELFEADSVVFFTSIRWWQTNSYYQKIIERLTWLENRHSTLWEENILIWKEAGIIIINQNWRGAEVLEVQKNVLKFFGFEIPRVLSWDWQYSNDADEESVQSYKDAFQSFKDTFVHRKS